MQKQPIFKRKQLVIAVGMAMLGGALTGCSSSSDSPAPGTFTYTANGGIAGSTNMAQGGEGGDINLYNGGGSGGVEIRKTGTANTKFSSPIKPAAANLGSNPLNITTDTTLKSVASTYSDGSGSFTAGDFYVGTDDVLRSSAADGPANYTNDPAVAAGTVYINYNDGHVYQYSGTAVSDDTEYSGLSVAAGITLTLGYPPNYTCSTSIRFTHDIDNSGTIAREADGCSVYMNANTYIASGSVVTSGNEDNERGGSVYINAATGISNKGSINASGFNENNDVNGDESGGDGGEINLNAEGYVINSGMLDSSGGDGKLSGGDGAEVLMRGAYVENNAEIKSSGGDNVSDPMTSNGGGDGGFVWLRSDYGVNNTADINTSGGDGYSGGDGAEITLYAYSYGQVKNAATLTTNGGHARLDGSGGDAGYIRMESHGEDLLNSGDWSAVGGDNTGDNATGSAGDGGYVSLYAYGGEGNKPTGDIVISGNINLSGGNAVATGSGSGGDAGDLYVNLYPTDAGTAQKLSMLGYVSIETNGGDGAEAGSAWGGSHYVRASDYYSNATQKYSAGSAMNEVPISSRGGNVTATDGNPNHGGFGGELNIQASTSDNVSKLGVTAKNTADIDVSGGNAVGDGGYYSYGGQGGEVGIEAFSGATNSGNLNLNGGDGGENGGYGGHSYLYSVTGASSNSGDVTSTGGDGAEFANSGGSFYVFGNSGSNSGDINVNGGNATMTETLLTSGGNGGYIGIMGLGITGKATNTGNVTYTFGTGDENGSEGCLQVGLTFTGNCN